MSLRPFVAMVALAVLSLPLASCSKPALPPASITLKGAGATFPEPLYKKWIEDYAKVKPTIRLTYKAVGSGKGVEWFQEDLVDFGASDDGMSEEKARKVARGVLRVPTAVGMVALAYNPEEIPGPLKLRRDVYADIFLGKIKRWNDPRIQESNPDLNLPDKAIAVIVRLDSSGTTFAFTNHLAAISKEWQAGPGKGKAIQWPNSAEVIRAPGNAGVGGMIQRTPYALGYVEYGLAKRLGLPMAILENKEGNFVPPEGGLAHAALLETPMPDNFLVFLPDPPGKQSYPIISYTWLLLYQKYDDPQQAAAIREFVHWCLTDGQSECEPLGFVRIPPEVVLRVLPKLKTIQ